MRQDLRASWPNEGILLRIASWHCLDMPTTITIRPTRLVNGRSIFQSRPHSWNCRVLRESVTCWISDGFSSCSNRAARFVLQNLSTQPQNQRQDANSKRGQVDMSLVLVTGANGFLGRSLVEQLTVSRTPTRTTGRKVHVPAGPVNYCPADLSDCPASTLRSLTNDTGTIIHAAGLAHRTDRSATNMTLFESNNIVATERLARAAVASGTKRFVFISSVSVYGDNQKPCAETAECRPNGPYAVSKFEAERRLVQLTEETKTQLVILRLATMYGEGDPGNVTRLMCLIDRGRFAWIGSGGNRKSLINHRDAARACLAVVSSSHADPLRIYNIAPTQYTMREIVETAARLLSKKVSRVRLAAPLARTPLRLARTIRLGGDRARQWLGTLEKWLSDDVFDGSRFQQDFGFQSEVSLEEGLRRQVQWYRSACDGGRRAA